MYFIMINVKIVTKKNFDYLVEIKNGGQKMVRIIIHKKTYQEKTKFEGEEIERNHYGISVKEVDGIQYFIPWQNIDYTEK